MTETGAERVEREDALLAALQEQCPDLDFHRLREMYLVLPKDTKFVSASTLTGLANRLARAGWLP